jgi:acyl-CoA oxidase
MYDASVSFKHVCVKFDDVLQMQSTQQRLIPMLATCYGLHFAKQLLVDRYCEMKRTKDHKLVEEV